MKLIPAIVCAVVLGVFSAIGDWIWANFLTDGAILPGVVHGVLIFLILALVLSWAVGTRRALNRLILSLPAAGMALAAVFYPLAGLTGYLTALILTWVMMWLALAILLRWSSDGSEGWARTLLRGGIAAIGSGLAFWTISGIWTQPSAEPVNYLVRALIWSYAFLPGFLALLLGQASPQRT